MRSFRLVHRLISLKDILQKRDEEIRRLKKRVEELERPDLFSVSGGEFKRALDVCMAVQDFFDEGGLYVPVEVHMARRTERKWVVLEEIRGFDDVDVYEISFDTKAAADRYCRGMRADQGVGA